MKRGHYKTKNPRVEIAALRLERGLLHKEIAEALGIDEHTVSYHWVNAKNDI